MTSDPNFPPAAEPTADVVRDVLLRQGIEASRIESVGGGFVSWTFDIDDAWIVQLPRFDAAVQATRMQIRLMPEVQAAVPFAVPVPELIAEWESRPVIRYRKVQGRPPTETDQCPPIAAMVRALHSFPAARAAQLLGCEPTTEAWRTRHAQFRDLMEQALLPQLDTQLGAAVSQHYERFLADPLDFTPCFVHCDLGAEHILVDPKTRRPAGLIDFDWAAVGDPAIDFVGMLTTLGPAATREAVASDEANVSWKRLLFYWWLTPCFGLVYGGAHLDQASVQEGINTLRHRLSVLSGLA